MKTIGFDLVLVAVALGIAAQGCAKAADTGGTSDGVGGFGGGSGGSVAEGTGASTSGAGGASTSSAGSSSSTTAAGSTTTGSSTSSSTTSSSASSSAASTGSGMTCPAGQHQCGGVCTGNTPQSGCFGSTDCTACTAPVNGTSTCTANGTCDFSCGGSYTKQGNTCVCSFSCCTDADCTAGSTCVAGSCSSAPPTCDSDACASGCVFSCLIQGKLGIGACNNGACSCTCV